MRPVISRMYVGAIGESSTSLAVTAARQGSLECVNFMSTDTSNRDLLRASIARKKRPRVHSLVKIVLSFCFRRFPDHPLSFFPLPCSLFMRSPSALYHPLTKKPANCSSLTSDNPNKQQSRCLIEMLPMSSSCRDIFSLREEKWCTLPPPRPG